MAGMLNIYFGSVLTDEDVENIPEPIKTSDLLNLECCKVQY